MAEFLQQFDPLYRDQLDDGEAESLAYLWLINDKSPDRHCICSADSTAFHVAGRLGLESFCVSFERLLSETGNSELIDGLAWKFQERFLDHYVKKGKIDKAYGIGLASDHTS